MLDYFFSGGPLFMGLLTLLLIATIVAAIKFPQYTKDLGQLALAVGILGLLLGLFEAFKAVEASGGVSQGMWAGGLKNALLPCLFGLIIYIFSSVLALIKK